MQLKEAIEARASVRKFAPEAVAVADLQEMVRCAGLAPSVNNEQPWKFIAVLNKSLMASMAQAVHRHLDQLFPDTPTARDQSVKNTVDYYSTFFKDAPALIAVASKNYEAMVDKLLPLTNMGHQDVNALRNYPDVQSIGAAIENLLLCAVDLGYGACWLSGMMMARQELEGLLQIAEPWHLTAFIAVGRPAGPVRQRDKKPIEEIFQVVE
ncbi:MAG TPA: nitroreductase family protein [bacterium]|nr:nitroreductase family protein [bacterium]HPN34371.1 nitroreductase family protein [bacterium]